MANDENLKPITNSEMARKLQEKSVAKRNENTKRRKLIKECFEVLLEQDITDSKGKTMTGIEAMTLKVFQKALKGDLKAFEHIRDSIGEKPADIVITSAVDEDTLFEIQELVDKAKENDEK